MIINVPDPENPSTKVFVDDLPAGKKLSVRVRAVLINQKVTANSNVVAFQTISGNVFLTLFIYHLLFLIETKEILLLKDMEKLKEKCENLYKRIKTWNNPSKITAKILLLGARGSGKSMRNFQKIFSIDKILGTYINTVYCPLNDGYYKVYAVTSDHSVTTTAW